MQTSTPPSNSRTITTRSSSQACAACKYQRRKCAPGCRLAPHFPSHARQDFLNAHKLFGVSNIIKSLQSLDDFELEKSAIKSMIYQANARARDPVGGCHRIICQLNTQIQNYEMELQFIRSQIAFHRGLATSSFSSNPSHGLYNTAPVQFLGYGQELVQQINEGGSREDECASGGIVKIEASSSLNGRRSGLSSSVLSGRGTGSLMDGLAAADGKGPFADDVSEHIKPYLGGVYDRDNTGFLDSKDLIKSSEQQVLVLTENNKPAQHHHQVNLQDSALQSAFTDGGRPLS